MKRMKEMTPKILAGVSITTLIAVFSFLPPIAQQYHYHNFSNDVAIASIPNFWNVVSNAGFVLSGIWGFYVVATWKIKSPIIKTLFAGIILTGIGSAYYHYAPNNHTLFWDRLPMTIVFTAFFSQLYAWYFSYQTAIRIWVFGFFLGIFSVLYWHLTEEFYCGDLRLYAIVQFLPILLIVIMCSLHWSENKIIRLPLILTFACYLFAKMAEHYDVEIFQHTHVISGHPIKHLAAALATACMVWMVNRYYKQLKT